MIRLIFLILLSVPSIAVSQEIRLKDLTYFEGVRGNNLVGQGLVVGLNGTGDSLRNSPFTEEMMSNILERLGVNVTGEQYRAKNVAAVIVTGTLSPFSRSGSAMDVVVSTIGDASSLLGGTLIMTPLKGADGQVYAVAQGSIIAGGRQAEGDAAKVVTGVPTSGTIPSGATVEQELQFDLNDLSSIRLALKNQDFSTANQITSAINTNFNANIAVMKDSATVLVDTSRASGLTPAQVLARIEGLRITPEVTAKIVVDQRSGTIVFNEDVRISEIAVSKGNLTIKITEQPVVSHPNPFSEGNSITVPRTDIEITRQGDESIAQFPDSSSLSDVIGSLNSLGATTDEIIDILKTIKAAGALHAEFLIL